MTVTPDFTMTMSQAPRADDPAARSTRVSTDETRPALTGRFSRSPTVRSPRGDRRTPASRALAETPAATKSPLQERIIIPLKALNHLQRLLSENTTRSIELSKNTRASRSDTTLTTKLIEGPFPTRAVLPKQKTKILRAKSDELAQALDRVSLFSDSLTARQILRSRTTS